MHDEFLTPGHEGELPSGVNLWRKGIVYTKRPDLPVGPGYRVSAAYKRHSWPTQMDEGFRGLYRRVAFMAGQRVSELTAEDPSLAAGIVCQGWARLGDAGAISTAFIMLALRSVAEMGVDNGWVQPPTGQDLHQPGGATLEDLTRLAPQWRAGELYSEFDFTDPNMSGLDLVSVSYGESVPEIQEGSSLDFRPFLQRAERFATTYHRMLAELDEVKTPFRIAHRQWFLADRKFVTILICFDS